MISILALPAQTQEGESLKIPFELKNGMIIVQASVNGDTGAFVLDTGSPNVVLNTRNVTGLRLAEANPQTQFDRSLAVKVNHFSWAGVERENMEAVAMDISHLESVSKQKILGVIGFDVLQNYEVLFNFERCHLILLPPRDNWMHRLNEPLHRLEFRLHGQLPVVKARVGGQRLRLGLDSGGTNLLGEEALAKLPEASVGPMEQQRMLGFGHRSQYLNAAELAPIEIDGQRFEATRFVFEDLPYLKEKRIDGLLGLPFLGQFRFSINYSKEEIYFWKYDAPMGEKKI